MDYNNHMKILWGYLKKVKWYILIGPFFKMAESLMDLLTPLLVAEIVKNGVALNDINYILKMALIILVVNVLALAFSVIGQKCSAVVSSKVAMFYRQDLFKQIAEFSHAELDKFGSATLVNRITNDVMQVENAISIFMRTLLRVPFLLIGACVLSALINVKMMLVFFILIPLVSVILFFYLKKTTPYFTKIRTKLDNISKVTKENLSGTRVIRAFNKQNDEQLRFENVTDDYTATCIKVSKISAFLNPLIFLIVDFATIAILYVGGWQINIGGMTQGDIIALVDYIAIITISLLAMSQIIIIFVRTIASIKRINEVLYTQSSVLDKNKKIKQTNYDNLMEFKNVCFNYSSDKNKRYFIKNLNFSILPKQTIGIIGGTGSGKTTIANLMTRFYDVTDGQILYKGRDIKDYPLPLLRKEISIVQQRSTLFSGSLRENMCLRNKNATDDEIIAALKISQAWPFVSEWTNGLDHQIMAGGKNVSGGQMQRLTIARALIDNPQMLILDDSSSALDFLTESKLRKELKKTDSTLVLISQRATTIKNADLIIVLDNGDVVGMGKHNQLMENCPIYNEIYTSQSK